MTKCSIHQNECFFHKNNFDNKLSEGFLIGLQKIDWELNICVLSFAFRCLDLRVPYLPHAIISKGVILGHVPSLPQKVDIFAGVIMGHTFFDQGVRNRLNISIHVKIQ